MRLSMKSSLYVSLVLILLVTATLPSRAIAFDNEWTGKVICYCFNANDCLGEGKESISPSSQTASTCEFPPCCNGVLGVTGNDVVARDRLPIQERVFFYQDLTYKNRVSSIFHPPELI